MTYRLFFNQLFFPFLIVAVISSSLMASGGDRKISGGGDKESADSLAVVTNFLESNAPKPVLFKRILDIDLGARMNNKENKIASWDTLDLNIYNVDMVNFRDTLVYTFHDPSKGVIFTMPVSGPVTSGFGHRNLFGSGFHYGVDMDLETGDPVAAAMDGVVRIARDSYGYGKMVLISHKDGLETLYGHLSTLNVREGQSVKSGEIIGLGGSTGRSTGSHLHFEIRVFGEQVNPSKLFSFHDGGVLPTTAKIEKSWFSYLSDGHRTGYHTTLEGENVEVVAEYYNVPTTVIYDLNTTIERGAALPAGTRVRYK